MFYSLLNERQRGFSFYYITLILFRQEENYSTGVEGGLGGSLEAFRRGTKGVGRMKNPLYGEGIGIIWSGDRKKSY